MQFCDIAIDDEGSLGTVLLFGTLCWVWGRIGMEKGTSLRVLWGGIYLSWVLMLVLRGVKLFVVVVLGALAAVLVVVVVSFVVFSTGEEIRIKSDENEK